MCKTAVKNKQFDSVLLDITCMDKNTAPLGYTNINVKGKIRINVTKIILRKYVEITVKIVLFFPLVLGNFLSHTVNRD